MMKRTSSAVVLSFCVVVFMSGCIPELKEQASESHEWDFASDAISRIDARSTNGKIHVSGNDQEKIHILAEVIVKARTKEKAEDFLKKVKVEAKQEGDTLRVTKDHPKVFTGYNINVNYSIQCPKSMNLDIGTTNGKITFVSVNGDLSASTTNGSIQLDKTAGKINAISTNGKIYGVIPELREAGNLGTTNGSIDVTVQKISGSLEAHTTNGSVKIFVPKNYEGKIEANTTNGGITCNLDVDKVAEDKRSRSVKHLKAVAGEEANNSLKLRTTNGSIRILKIEEE